MKTFTYQSKFFSDIDELIDWLDQEEEGVEQLEDNWEIQCYETNHEPIVQMSSQWIAEMIDCERFSDDGIDNEIEKIEKVLNENIDFEKINSLIPKLYYENTFKKFKITKQDLIARISETKQKLKNGKIKSLRI